MISAVWAMPLDPSVCSSVCLPHRALLSSDSSYKHFKKVITNYNNKLIWPKILSMEPIKAKHLYYPNYYYLKIFREPVLHQAMKLSVINLR